MTRNTSDKRSQESRSRGASPAAAGPPAPSASDEPAQGRVDTQTRYRDRPTDDGKHGDGDGVPDQDGKTRDSPDNSGVSGGE
jgi:hypothetical protein